MKAPRKARTICTRASAVPSTQEAKCLYNYDEEWSAQNPIPQTHGLWEDRTFFMSTKAFATICGVTEWKKCKTPRVHTSIGTKNLLIGVWASPPFRMWIQPRCVTCFPYVTRGDSLRPGHAYKRHWSIYVRVVLSKKNSSPGAWVHQLLRVCHNGIVYTRPVTSSTICRDLNKDEPSTPRCFLSSVCLCVCLYERFSLRLCVWVSVCVILLLPRSFCLFICVCLSVFLCLCLSYVCVRDVSILTIRWA